MCHDAIDFLLLLKNQSGVITIWLILNCDNFFSWWQVARKICSSLDLSWEGSTRLLLGLLKCATDSVVCLKVKIKYFICISAT